MAQYKILVSRSTAEGEALSFEVSGYKPGDNLSEIMAPIYDACDERLVEMNRRIIAAHTMIQQLPPEAQQAVHSVYEVMFGRRTPTPGELGVKAVLADATGGKVEIPVDMSLPANTPGLVKEGDGDAAAG